MTNKRVSTILAHAGGGAHAPENTLAAFKRGLADGADGFELDVHLSRDGVPVVIHDFDLQRVAGIQAPVASQTARELAALDVGSWFGPEFSEQGVPALEEVLALAQGKHLAINVEIKAGYRIYPGIEERCLELAAQLQECRVIFSSFDHYCLRRLKEIDRRAVTGALHGCSLIDAHEYAHQIGVDALHPQYMVVDPDYVAGCRRRGLKVHTWTVNDPVQAVQQWKLGVDAIITDDPAMVRAALEGSRGETGG
jgi:glycerophosphoryl diester phosphodiesterase